MSESREKTTGKSNLIPNIDEVMLAARLLVDDPRTVRSNIRFFGQKFPLVELTLSTPDYDKKQGNGSRVSYFGTIDRATRDAFELQPSVRLESGSESVDVPVIPRLPMMADGERIADMPPEQQELVVRLASKILVELGITSPAK